MNEYAKSTGDADSRLHFKATFWVRFDFWWVEKVLCAVKRCQRPQNVYFEARALWTWTQPQCHAVAWGSAVLPPSRHRRGRIKKCCFFFPFCNSCRKFQRFYCWCLGLCCLLCSFVGERWICFHRWGGELFGEKFRRPGWKGTCEVGRRTRRFCSSKRAKGFFVFFFHCCWDTVIDRSPATCCQQFTAVWGFAFCTLLSWRPMGALVVEAVWSFRPCVASALTRAALFSPLPDQWWGGRWSVWPKVWHPSGSTQPQPQLLLLRPEVNANTVNMNMRHQGNSKKKKEKQHILPCSLVS